LSQSLDRPINSQRWSKDGKSIAVLFDDDTQCWLGLYDIRSGTMKKVAGGNKGFEGLEAQPDGNWVSLISESNEPPELFAVKENTLTKLTATHDKFTDSLIFAEVEKFSFKNKEGIMVSGLIYYPPGTNRKNLPLIHYIHGGPVQQDDFGFNLNAQILAAHGYAIAKVNYRGSSGRGIKFSNAISGDWGNKEVDDILAATDYLVEKGIADPNRLGVSGWSYGGILTDYIIAKDNRFKAACSGAGMGAPLSLYGIDQYILQYDNEIGQPWKEKNFEKYLKLSYPLLHADRIKTPTLFIAGEKDFNVPAAGSEQMYQALRSLNVPTGLLIYPGQYHGFTQPSFIKDRYERYLEWFDRYLK
jgi:dipeptidyl aminopeptidase/acylaminoacyl peptidase